MQDTLHYDHVPQLSLQINHHQLWCGSDEKMQRLDENTHVAMDDHGNIVKAQYANGSKLIRHRQYVLVSSHHGSNWFGSNTGKWFVLD